MFDDSCKKHAPASLRNRGPIKEILQKHLPANGRVLEIASGSGEHCLYYADHFPELTFQPSDKDTQALASIKAYAQECRYNNIEDPLSLDCLSIQNWPEIKAQAIICINMCHIAPWQASCGLFFKAGEILDTGPLVIYGPFFEDNVKTSQSNLAFDESLKKRDPQWGLRYVENITGLAEQNGLTLMARYNMPANNLTLVFSRRQEQINFKN